MILALMVATLAIFTVALGTGIGANGGYVRASLVSLMSFSTMLTKSVKA
jgi:hypothetical protein